MKREMNEIVHDNGKVIVRRLGVAEFIGFRVKTWETIRSRNVCHITDRFDLQEMDDMKKLAGLDLPCGYHGPRKNLKKDAATKALAFEWMTRPWK